MVAPQAGEHELRVVVTDTNGKKGESSCVVNCVETKTSYDLAQTFKSEGVVPQNWYVTHGRSKRVGGGLPYTTGSRILRFTNEARSFEYGLMVQNIGGNEKAAWARFGDKAARSHMKLHAGQYQLRARLCNWNQPELTSVIFAVEKPDGEVVTSEVYKQTKNIGGDTGNSFSSGRTKTFKFDIPETGDYVITFYADAVKNADFVLGMATLDAKAFSETGIREISRDDVHTPKSGCYDLSGRKIEESQLSNGQLKPGIYIIDGRKVAIK